MDLRKEFEEETKDQLYYWFQEYSGASMEEHGFSEEYVEWLEAKVKKLSLHSVSGCFPTDKEIELLSNKHSDDMGLRPNTYHSYKDGMEECIDIIKKNIFNNR